MGFARLKEANPERHPGPQRCRYANIAICNAHHASHVEGLMQTTSFGGLEVFNTNLVARQPLPPVARKKTPAGANLHKGISRCAPTPPLSPSEDRLANILSHLGRMFGEEILGRISVRMFMDFFCRSPCGLLEKSETKSAQKSAPKSQKIRTTNPQEKSEGEKGHRKICTKILTKNPLTKIRTQKSAHKTPHAKSPCRAAFIRTSPNSRLNHDTG